MSAHSSSLVFGFVGFLREGFSSRFLQPFERGNSKEGGHGLGLAIVQRLCERFDWHLDVASRPGKGTEVRVRF